jgi:hypothetical protein
MVEWLDRKGPEPRPFSPGVARVSDTPGGRLQWVEGLAREMKRSYETGEMPEIHGW